MAWYVIFHSRVPGVYASRAICSDQVLGFSSASFRSYATGNGAAAYATYLHHDKKKHKAEDAKTWSWKDVLISVQIVLILFLCYKLM
jgi:viroplasmin and RNaseH domain-containing protein